MPKDHANADAYLRYLTMIGAKKRWGAPLPKEARERVNFELEVIKDMGFASYFLILWDLVRYAAESGIATGPGRGSAAGSVVSYSLGITQLDPIKYDLLFERFLNPSRISMPDIDLDMDSRYRDDMIKYTAQKYGEDHVAQIITFGQIKARAAVRDAAKVLGYGYALGDKIAKAMPPVVMGRDTPLHACLKLEEKHRDGYAAATEVRRMYNSDSQIKEVIDVALGLEGLRRSDGIHAAAVVISDLPITEYLPIQRKGEDKPIVTQFEMNNVEELGLLKMDFLGLRNLDIIDITKKLLKSIHDVDLNMFDIPMDDNKTLELLRNGDTLGVFQLESPQMRELLKRLEPTSFDDIAAVVALYRPGPMASNMHLDYADRKNGRQRVSFFHEDARPVLKDTYGLMIYQEQMMRIAQKFGGYSLAEADNLRKACGKKIREMMAKEKDKLIERICENGYDSGLANYIWDMIEPFADYSFNKSHAYAYGLIAYQTAYLKANYPIEYMAGMLTCIDKADKLAVQLGECKRMGIEVLPPDVNDSIGVFKPIVDENKILFSLNAVKNVAGTTGDLIVEERAKSKFLGFGDFVERMTARLVNKKTLENLIKGGAFDSYGHNRRTMVESLGPLQTAARKKIKEAEKGVMTLFETPPTPIVNIDEYDDKTKMAFEKDSLGVYLTDHPLNRVRHIFDDDPSIVPVVELPNLFGKQTIMGMLFETKIVKTKKGDQMAVLKLEDLHSEIEVIVFPKTMKIFTNLVKDDNIVKIVGQLSMEGKFIVDSIVGVDTVQESVV